MVASRLLITRCPIPAEASATADSVAIARIAQRGRRRGAGGHGGRCVRSGAGRPPRGRGRPAPDRAGERGGVLGMETSAGAGWGPKPYVGSVSTVGPYDLLTGAAAPAARTGVARSR
ncbi:hypothetical protein GCM10010389_42270 [Streptomyces echinoruber]|uniref:Uncharacterized protein n=1 Tax=Streptomyces echinoruber TaxID=68898 RepID=A0A918RH35_9ACTN|nr:hypothetical protein GCM10010389_42270 [Streptomyces echinoruber]